MNIIPLAHIIVSLFYLWAIIYILRRNSRARANILGALLFCTFLIWSLAYALIHIASDSTQAMFWINISSFGWCTFSFIGLWFYLDFTGHKTITENKLYLTLLALPSILFIYLQWSGYLVNDAILEFYGWAGVWKIPGFSYAYFAYYAVINIICICLCLTLKTKDGSPRRKRQILLLVSTASVSFILGSITDVVLPVLNIYVHPQMADVFVAIWGTGIMLAITRYGLLGLTPNMVADTIIDTMKDTLILLDKEKKIVFVNKAASELIGKQIELVGKPFSCIVADEKSAVDLLNHTITSGSVTDVDLMFNTRDGGEVPMHISSSVIRNKMEPFLGMVIVARDMSIRIKNELEIIEQRNIINEILQNVPSAVIVVDHNLNILVANRTFNKLIGSDETDNVLIDSIISSEEFINSAREVIQNKKTTCDFEFRDTINEVERIFLSKIVSMSQAKALILLEDITVEKERQDKLFLADRLATVGEMASGIAHELNNPLTSIIALSKLLQDQDLPGDIEEDVSYINSEAQRAAVIVKNMLTFARKHPAVFQPTSVNKIIEDVVKIRSYENKINNINVQTFLSPDLPLIMVNYFQIQQVFLNLLLNAEGAMLETTGRERVLKIITEKEDNNIKIYFIDSGSGIAKENMDRVFDPFFTTKEVGKGTGLGLSICYGIISSHKGRISVQSELNQGTTFTLELPVDVEQDEYSTGLMAEKQESSVPAGK